MRVVFFRTGGGGEPVREWLLSQPRSSKKAIGEDIKTVQFGWPLGMPLVEKIGSDLWEIRTKIPHGVARVLFTVDGHLIVLLHGFIKKSKKIPGDDLEIARARLRLYQKAEK